MDRSSQKITMILVLFGLPATGKSYIGKLLEDEFGFFFYDGDEDLTPQMKKAIKEKRIFTDDMRDVFFQNLITSVKRLKKTQTKLVVAQAFIKEKYRKQFVKHFPQTRFILIQTKNKVRTNRLTQRNDLDLEYVEKMNKLFEKPAIKHFVIENNTDGQKELVQQLEYFLAHQNIQK